MTEILIIGIVANLLTAYLLTYKNGWNSDVRPVELFLFIVPYVGFLACIAVTSYYGAKELKQKYKRGKNGKTKH